MAVMGILALVFALAGIAMLTFGGDVSQIKGFILFVVSAVFWVGTILAETLDKIRKRIEAELTRQEDSA